MNSWNRVVYLFVLLLMVWGIGCESVQDGYKFLCIRDRNDWQLCNENRVRYCHIDHFHTGQNCDKLGLSCVETSEKTAVCVDKTKSCSAGSVTCEDNVASNCIDGVPSIEPCGTAKKCEIGENGAYCKSLKVECGGNGELHDGMCECKDGYKTDPADAQACIPN